MVNSSCRTGRTGPLKNKLLVALVGFFYSSLTVLLLPILFIGPATAYSTELRITAAGSSVMEAAGIEHTDQLPQSRVAKGSRNIREAWLASPTHRYRHGVLGDNLEAARLSVETVDGVHLSVDLPPSRVFEDLEPRLVDLNRDKLDEIMVVESDTALGASLSVYGIVDSRLVRTAATPFLGQPNRWLNPVGVGDFDGDGRLDIALVATPHIGGLLRLYRVEGDRLALFAQYSGVSTHRIGSTDLGLGRVVPALPRDRLLVPNQARRELMLLEWTGHQWQEIARVELPGVLGSSLKPMRDGCWQFRLENGQYYDIQLDH